MRLYSFVLAWCALTAPSCGSDGAAPSMSSATVADAPVNAGHAGAARASGTGGVGNAAAGAPARPQTGAAGVAGSEGGGHGANTPAAEGGRGGAVSAGAGSPAAAGAAGLAGGAPAGSGPGAYAACPAAPEPCKILPFGDSITFGIGFAGGYRVELFRKALAAGRHITYLGSLSNGPDKVDGQPFPKQNEGHSGWKIAQLEPLIPSPALDTVPDIVLLMIGTNDIAQRDNLAAAPDRLSSLLDKLKGAAPEALVVVAQITPLGNTSSEQAIETYNMAVSDLVAKRVAAGEHIKLVDMYTGFPTSELGDGVHPNETGYARMAGVWYAAISDSLH